MAAWTLIPCLIKLTEEFNAIAPSRDKGADGSIGDSSHTSSSDHTPDEDSRILRDHDADDKNEVHAKDIDSTGPWPGSGTQKERFHAIVMRIIAGEKRKWLSADDKCRLNYVIWDRKIYDKDNDFEPRAYTLSDPHTNHAHFSGRYESSCESDTRSWGIYVPPAPPKETDDMTPAEFLALLKDPAVAAEMKKLAGQGVHGQRLGASEVTIAHVLQPLPSQIGTLTAYASLEAAEVPPTAQENAAAVVAALEPLPEEPGTEQG